jgi:hypothetical protein
MKKKRLLSEKRIFFVSTKKFSNTIFLLYSITLFSQNHSVYGVVTDTNSGERLIGATIFIPNTNLYTISNSYGFYSLVSKNIKEN